jgi:sugar transferase (PEP-CTERM/EpsH1 system associated)
MFASSRLENILRQWATSEKFDCVIAYCSSMAAFAFLPELNGTPVLVDLVDVDSQKWMDYSQQSSGIKSAFYALEGRRLRKLESQLTQDATAIALVSEAEAELFRSVCPNSRTHAILNGVDLEYFRVRNPPEPVRPQSCVFVGALDYGANIDALEWFGKQVWPELKRQEPQATLELVGRRPSKAVRKLGELPGVTLAADVLDVRPYLERAALAIAPLRIARGIQNKVLEALAMGKAVVASPGATTGLRLQPGHQVVVAENPAEWIASLRRLWSSESERLRLGIEGRNYVELHHSWESTLAPWQHLILASAPSTEAEQSHGATLAKSSRQTMAADTIEKVVASESLPNASRGESLSASNRTESG